MERDKGPGGRMDILRVITYFFSFFIFGLEDFGLMREKPYKFTAVGLLAWRGVVSRYRGSVRWSPCGFAMKV